MEQPKWRFTGTNGDFELKDPERSSFLYFPLVNEAGMMSSVTPKLHGMATAGHNSFLTAPVSVEDLHQSRTGRNFWVHIEGLGVWSAAGDSARQNALAYTPQADRCELEAGLLWHRVTRTSGEYPLKAEITSFVPGGAGKVELMKVVLTNTGADEQLVTPTAAVPLYARSADDLRDHRHVTSLLNRIYTSEFGVEVQPALSFDERGHRVNQASYAVLGADETGAPPVGLFPVQEEFTGEGGSLDWPEAAVRNLPPSMNAAQSTGREGYEALGGLRFASALLQPGESRAYILVLAIGDGRIAVPEIMAGYGTAAAFDRLLEENKRFWAAKVDTLKFHTGSGDYDQWMKWVTLQPILRRLYGNSFLPYHDYGRGGRGWRDLWQDCLALLMMEPEDVRSLLLNNYAGVRIDGSNATIIGKEPGEFIADRNNIPRVWMDHGAWPLLTTMLYLNQSGDLGFLLEEQVYFRDAFMNRCQSRDASWSAAAGSILRTAEGEVYKGTVLEHIMLQHLVPFFNVGEHNNILLEGADWNDGLDMATRRGESVAFSAFYASNLYDLAELLAALKERSGVTTLRLAEELEWLLDSLTEAVDYNSVQAKRERLERYYAAAPNRVSGMKAELPLEQVAEDLRRKAEWMFGHLRKNEWVESGQGGGWFNGYYNNDGERVEGEFPGGVRMTLTGQVFPLLGHAASPEQVPAMIAAVERNLCDPRIGYRLNTDFGGIQQNLGRAFGFAYGHKENGAMFSHMTVMYANALYKRGYVREGYKVLDSLYRLSSDFATSRIYPGIPEYINEQGRGMYTYLTGSASWLLLTMVNEVFGVKGKLGDLLLQPKLVGEQFDSAGQASIQTLFAGHELEIVYKAAGSREYGEYQIHSVLLNGTVVTLQRVSEGVLIARGVLEALEAGRTHLLEVQFI